MPRRLPAALLLALLASPSVAQPSDPKTPVPALPTDASPDSGLQVDLRSEYLAGEPLIFAFTFTNPSTTSIQAPDIANRPWLIEFELLTPGGQTQRRRTTPPKDDPGRMVTIAPGGQRRTLLQLPSGGALPPGDYQLQVRMIEGETTTALANAPVRISRSHPTHADFHKPLDPSGRQPVQTLWTHAATTGVDLYLHEADPKSADKVLGDHHLLHSATPIAPLLSEARPSDQPARHIVWSETTRSIRYARVQGTQLHREPRRVDIPWPVHEIAGSPATDSDGQLHLPLWIPAPSGKAGTLRVMAISDRGVPSFRNAASLKSRPDDVQTTVDAGGTVHFLVRQAGNIDLYSVHAGPTAQPGLPVPGRRLLKSQPDAVAAAARFSVLPPDGAHPGGLAVAMIVAQPDGLQPRWVGLKGDAITALAPITPPAGATVVDLVANGATPPALVLRNAEGGLLVMDGASSAPLPAGESWQLLRTRDGSLMLRDTVRGGPIRTRRLASP